MSTKPTGAEEEESAVAAKSSKALVVDWDIKGAL